MCFVLVTTDEDVKLAYFPLHIPCEQYKPVLRLNMRHELCCILHRHNPVTVFTSSKNKSFHEMKCRQCLWVLSIIISAIYRRSEAHREYMSNRSAWLSSCPWLSLLGTHALIQFVNCRRVHLCSLLGTPMCEI